MTAICAHFVRRKSGVKSSEAKISAGRIHFARGCEIIGVPRKIEDFVGRALKL